MSARWGMAGGLLLVLGATGWALAACGGTADPSPATPPQSSDALPGLRCDRIEGTFTDVFLQGPVCSPTSPLELCTQGQLEGDLVARYDFFFVTVTTVARQDDNIAEAFTGTSHIDFGDAGTLTSQDHGDILMKSQGLSPFVTHIVIEQGTGAYASTQGALTADGRVNLATGDGSGTYHGFLCNLPKAQ